MVAVVGIGFPRLGQTIACHCLVWARDHAKQTQKKKKTRSPGHIAKIARVSYNLPEERGYTREN